MPRFKCGVTGPVPLADGRVVTADDGPFDLDIPTAEDGEWSHDQDLVDRGVIVPVEAAAPADKPVAAASTKATSKGGD
jgi:hypothetical protein